MFDKMKALYDSLSDEMSKYIFRERLYYGLSGDWSDFRKFLIGLRNDSEVFEGKHFLDILENPDILTGQEVIMFGAGDLGRSIKNDLNRVGI